MLTPVREAGWSDPRLRPLLAQAVWDPDGSRTDVWLGRYREKGDLLLHRWRKTGKTTGLLGIRQAIDGTEITHIAVDPRVRRRGTGRRMIDAWRLRHPGPLRAETDRDAVGFYQRCGFTITPLGENYPERERFRCVWAPREQGGPPFSW